MPVQKIDIMPYNIDPSIHSIRIFIDNFQLGSPDCWCCVYQYDINDKLIMMTRVYVPPDVYSEWGTNDDFIEDWVMDYLGMMRKPDLLIDFGCERNDF